MRFFACFDFSFFFPLEAFPIVNERVSVDSCKPFEKRVGCRCVAPPSALLAPENIQSQNYSIPANAAAAICSDTSLQSVRTTMAQPLPPPPRRLQSAGGLDVGNLRRVLSFLEPKDLCAASQVNVLWNGASSTDALWGLLARHHGWGDPVAERSGYRRFACFNFKVRARGHLLCSCDSICGAWVVVTQSAVSRAALLCSQVRHV